MPTPVTIEIPVPVSPETAWRAFNPPEAVTRWNFSSADWRCPSAEIDLRAGGRHVARMEACDGSMGFDYSGVYEEVDAPRLVVLRLDDGRLVRTTFEAHGGVTRVRTVFDPLTETDCERLGWQAILDNYALYVTDFAR